MSCVHACICVCVCVCHRVCAHLSSKVPRVPYLAYQLTEPSDQLTLTRLIVTGDEEEVTVDTHTHTDT